MSVAVDRINISDLNKADVFAALYNNARVQGLGVLHAIQENMTREEAQQILDEGGGYFDYFRGRVMKIDLTTDDLVPFLYDRDNGEGRVAQIVEGLRNGASIDVIYNEDASDWDDNFMREVLRSFV
jgi:hypothetical protein